MMTALTWFITRCSSGFGEILVRQLRAAGDNVIATGRNADTKLSHPKDTLERRSLTWMPRRLPPKSRPKSAKLGKSIQGGSTSWSIMLAALSAERLKN
ncbi:hypothetical protein V8C34DRAFT_290345 [Trichoderma compactum]